MLANTVHRRASEWLAHDALNDAQEAALQHRQAAQLLEDAYSADQEARQAAAASDYAAKQAIRQLTARVAQLEQVEDELCNCRTRLAAAEKAAACAASQAEVVSTNFVGACSCLRCFFCHSRLSLAKLTCVSATAFLWKRSVTMKVTDIWPAVQEHTQQLQQAQAQKDIDLVTAAKNAAHLRSVEEVSRLQAINDELKALLKQSERPEQHEKACQTSSPNILLREPCGWEQPNDRHGWPCSESSHLALEHDSDCDLIARSQMQAHCQPQQYLRDVHDVRFQRHLHRAGSVHCAVPGVTWQILRHVSVTVIPHSTRKRSNRMKEAKQRTIHFMCSCIVNCMLSMGKYKKLLAVNMQLNHWRNQHTLLWDLCRHWLHPKLKSIRYMLLPLAGVRLLAVVSLCCLQQLVSDVVSVCLQREMQVYKAKMLALVDVRSVTV
jgi:hypothetical protein